MQVFLSLTKILLAVFHFTGAKTKAQMNEGIQQGHRSISSSSGKRTQVI